MGNRRLKKLLNQKNNSRPLLALASLGLLLLLVGTFTLPFNNGLFSHLFTKPASHADTMTMMGPQHIGCTFLSDPNATPAFCDTFQTPNPGGRGGDLDESHWDFSAIAAINNPGGQLNWFAPTTAQFCKDQIIGVLPPHESFFCGTQFNEAEHWMETFNDYGGFAYNDAMIRQPFDFTNRTGTVTFEVDAKTAGGHEWWPDVWITDTPMPAPQLNQFHSVPENGIDLVFSDTCNTSPNATEASIDVIHIVRNYQATDYLTSGNGFTKFGCYTTADDMANHFEIRISQNKLEVWATDDDQTNFHKITEADNINLPFTTGYVHFEHSDYNAEKFGVKGQQTYHWHNMGFDGPILPIQRGYSIPDALAPAYYGKTLGMNLGYDVQSNSGVVTCCNSKGTYSVSPFSIPNVDLSNATGAFISMDAFYRSMDQSILYRLNGGTWHTFAFPFPQIFAWGGANGIVIPIPVSELKQGTNTIELNQATTSPLIIANIDLVVQTSQIPPAPSPVYMFTPQASVPPFPAHQFNVTTSVTPTSLDQQQVATVSAQVSNITSAPISGQLVFGVIGPNGNMDYEELYNNSNNTVFQPGQTINHSFSFTVPTAEEPNNNWSDLGTYKAIVTILSPDQSSILYTNSDAAEFSVPSGTTPTPSASSTPMMSMSPNPSMTPIPSTTTGTLQGDFNGDSHVNLQDLSIFAGSYGTSSPNIPTPSCDLNGDGKVTLTDLSIFSSKFGK